MGSEDARTAQNESQGGPAVVPAEKLSIHLKIISPNFSQPMTLPDLPALLTVQELKERIRLQLPSRPTDSQQRLIYRGRMVGRPEEKLLDLFGEDMVGSAPGLCMLPLCRARD
jgi:hypothetical protein